MATIKVKPLVPGDWLRTEALNQRSRKIITGLSGQKLACGQVCRLDNAGKANAITATGDESHNYAFDATPSAGTFTVTMWHYLGYWVTTAAISYTATQAAVIIALNQALLQADSGAVSSVVTEDGGHIASFTIVFDGTNYTGKTFPLGQLDHSGLTGVTSTTITRSVSAGLAQDEVQTFTAHATMTGGTIGFTIWTPGERDDTIPGGVPLNVNVAWDTNWATTMAALNTAITAAATAWYGGASAGVVVTGDMNKDIVCTFSGVGFTGLAQPRMVLWDLTGCTSCTYLDGVLTTAGGTAGNRIGQVAEVIAFELVDCTATHPAGAAADREGLFIDREAKIDKDAVIYGGGDPAACIIALEAKDILAVDESANLLLPV